MVTITKIPDGMTLEKITEMIEDNDRKIMNINHKINDYACKIRKLDNDLEKAHMEADRLCLMRFYIANGMKPGQPFMCRGERVVNVSCYCQMITGTYLTKRGTRSYSPMQIYGEITPLQEEQI